jgi:hypothetical protein
MIARWVIAGFLLWLAITVPFRMAGEQFFIKGGVSWLFLVAPPVMFVLTYLLLKIFRVEPNDRAEAAGVFALPGLVIGIYQMNSFNAVFPNLDTSLNGEFAALMFASYAAIIIAGIVTSRIRQFDNQV